MAPIRFERHNPTWDAIPASNTPPILFNHEGGVLMGTVRLFSLRELHRIEERTRGFDGVLLGSQVVLIESLRIAVA